MHIQRLASIIEHQGNGSQTHKYSRVRISRIHQTRGPARRISNRDRTRAGTREWICRIICSGFSGFDFEERSEKDPVYPQEHVYMWQMDVYKVRVLRVHMWCLEENGLGRIEEVHRQWGFPVDRIRKVN